MLSAANTSALHQHIRQGYSHKCLLFLRLRHPDLIYSFRANSPVNERCHRFAQKRISPMRSFHLYCLNSFPLPMYCLYKHKVRMRFFICAPPIFMKYILSSYSFSVTTILILLRIFIEPTSAFSGTSTA